MRGIEEPYPITAKVVLLNLNPGHSKAMTEHTCELTSDDVPEDVCGAPATKKVVTRYGTIWACDDHYQSCGYDPDFFET